MDKRFLFIIGVIAVTGIFLSTLVGIVKKSPVSYGISHKDLGQALQTEMAATHFKIDHPLAPPPAAAPINRDFKLPVAQRTNGLQAKTVAVHLNDPKKKRDERRKQIAAEKKAKERARRKKRKKHLEELARRKQEEEERARRPRLQVQIVNNQQRDGLGNDWPSANTQTEQTQTTQAEQQLRDQQERLKKAIAELEQRLLQSPTLEDLTKYLKLVQAGRVDMGQFYALTKKMAQSQNMMARRLAVYAVGSFASAESFQILAELAYDPDAHVKSDAQTVLRNYENPAYFSLFAEEMANGDVYSRLKSTELVNALAISAASEASNPGEENINGRSSRRQPGNSSASVSKAAFARFIPYLESFLGNTDSGQLRDLAQQALNAISHLS